jgi:GT2 family glycosyltransferase
LKNAGNIETDQNLPLFHHISIKNPTRGDWTIIAFPQVRRQNSVVVVRTVARSGKGISAYIASGKGVSIWGLHVGDKASLLSVRANDSAQKLKLFALKPGRFSWGLRAIMRLRALACEFLMDRFGHFDNWLNLLSNEATGTSTGINTRATAHFSDISIVVPSRDRPDLLERLHHTVFSSVLADGGEVIVIDHASSKEATAACLDGLRNAGCQIVRAEGVFNYSRLINMGADRATKEHLLILNDDVMPQDDTSLIRLIQSPTFRSNRIVAPVLIYPDGGIQHAGIVLGMGGLAGHIARRAPLNSPSARAWLGGPRAVSAVTGALLLVDRHLFHRLGGLDLAYSVECGDIDFCLRAEAVGAQSWIEPQSVWIHEESQTRGVEQSQLSTPVYRDRLRFFLQWSESCRLDVHVPLNLSRETEHITPIWPPYAGV